MSDVTRYAIGWREFSTYEDVHGQYVLAADYDALQRRVEELRTWIQYQWCPNCANCCGDCDWITERDNLLGKHDG